MAIPAMMVDPMLDPFRGMLADVDGRGLTGPDVDEMRAQLARMEQLAAELSDLGAYSGQLAQEQVFQKFSDAYSRALTAAAAPQDDAPPDDAQLLENTVGAYADTLAMYERGEAGEEAELLIPALRRMVELGRSGLSYPVYLRSLEEEGLSRALDGAAPAARSGLEQELRFAEEAWLPRKVEERQQALALFDELAARAPFGQPEPTEFALRRSRIEWEFAPAHARWSAEVDRWSHLLDMLVDWVDSYTSFAPRDDRWVPMGNPDPVAVKRNIERTQQCTPGRLVYRLGVYRELFALEWDGIWASESYLVEYTARRVDWSDERLQLVHQTFPHCVPGGRPPAELVARAEQLHPAGDPRPDRGQAPPWGTPLANPPR